MWGEKTFLPISSKSLTRVGLLYWVFPFLHKADIIEPRARQRCQIQEQGLPQEPRGGGFEKGELEQKDQWGATGQRRGTEQEWLRFSADSCGPASWELRPGRKVLIRLMGQEAEETQGGRTSLFRQHGADIDIIGSSKTWLTGLP